MAVVIEVGREVSHGREVADYVAPCSRLQGAKERGRNWGPNIA